MSTCMTVCIVLPAVALCMVPSVATFQCYHSRVPQILCVSDGIQLRLSAREAILAEFSAAVLFMFTTLPGFAAAAYVPAIVLERPLYARQVLLLHCLGNQPRIGFAQVQQLLLMSTLITVKRVASAHIDRLQLYAAWISFMKVFATSRYLPCKHAAAD